MTAVQRAAASPPVDQQHEMMISSLLPGDSPRGSGIDAEHVAVLAELTEFPPILVNKHTNRVIDGMHRLHAAKLKGWKWIKVEYFEGDDEEAFIQSVKLNVLHGLPLSLSERKAAAARILASRPDLSDRATAVVTGLSDKTVAAVRARSTSEIPPLKSRLGHDGRSRPLDGKEGRRRAEEFLAYSPTASLREIAAAAGISIGTAHNVRKDFQQRRSLDNLSSRSNPDMTATSNFKVSPIVSSEDRDHRPILLRLSRDPSLRLTESGRDLLRWLHGHSVGQRDWREVVMTIPPHWASSIARLARQNAAAWHEIAQQLDEIADHSNRRRTWEKFGNSELYRPNFKFTPDKSLTSPADSCVRTQAR